MDGLEKLRNSGLNIAESDGALFAVVAADADTLARLYVFRAYLYAERDTFHLVFGEFPSGRIFGEIAFDPEPRGFEPPDEFLGFPDDSLFMLSYG